MKSSVVILTKNDNYGGDLSHRAKMCVNSLVENFDEVVIVDWKTRDGKTLLSTFIDEVPHIGKIKSIEVSSDLLKEKYPQFYQWNILEALGRNIGIRRATGDWIASTNVDIVTTPLDFSSLNPNEFYTSSRRDVDENFHKGFQKYNDLKTTLWNNRDSYRDKPQIHNSSDKWSLVICCGDFQVGTKEVWEKSKGFEESILFGCGIDSNIMKKASYYSEIKILPYYFFHLNHGKGGVRFDGEQTPPMSNQTSVIQDFTTTTNDENWGLINENFKIEII